MTKPDPADRPPRQGLHSIPTTAGCLVGLFLVLLVLFALDILRRLLF